MSYKYIVLEDDEVFYDIDDVIEHCIAEDYHEDDSYFEDWVNDHEDSVTINGETYQPYDILENLDEGNLNDLRGEFCERMNEDDESDARYELNHAEENEEVHIQNYTVKVVEDSDEGKEEEQECYDESTAMENLRARLEQNKQLNQSIKEETKKSEEDLMKMFQIVGG